MRSTIAVATMALLLAGCSTERIMESALERVDGVGDVDFDLEGGSFSISNEDGEEFGIDVDPDTGESTIRTHEGELSTSPVDEVPAEIAAVVRLPAAFVPGTLSRGDVDGGTQLLLQGEITGEFAALAEELEAGVSAAGWDHVERQGLGESGHAMIMGRDEADAGDTDPGVMVSLMMGDDGQGLVQVILLEP